MQVRLRAAPSLSSIVKISSQPLRPSPYVAYRDPKTGQWLIAKQDQNKDNTNQLNSIPEDQDRP